MISCAHAGTSHADCANPGIGMYKFMIINQLFYFAMATVCQGSKSCRVPNTSFQCRQVRGTVGLVQELSEQHFGNKRGKLQGTMWKRIAHMKAERFVSA